MIKNILKFFVLILLAILSQSCVSISTGESLRIVTDKSTDDFLVKCTETNDYFIGHNASSYTTSGKVFVAKSNDDISCGLLIIGYNSSARVRHPTYYLVGSKGYRSVAKK